ncbi:MAG: rRNA maturation RNase YbeY [Acidimicrobiia bacterium]
MNVFLADEQAEPVDGSAIRSLVAGVLEAEGYPSDTEVAVLLVSEEQIAEHNRRFLEREGPTDVLAFPLEELTPGRPPRPAGNGPPLALGDVILAPAYLRRQAGDLGVRFDEELALTVVHGVLHLLGYDHQEDDEAGVMEARERMLLAGHRGGAPRGRQA